MVVFLGSQLIVTPVDLLSGAIGDLIQQVVATTPIGRYADPGELANSALFLASDLSSYVTGTYLAVDGAYMAA